MYACTTIIRPYIPYWKACQYSTGTWYPCVFEQYRYRIPYLVSGIPGIYYTCIRFP